MKQNEYEILKIETKIDVLEKELSSLFADFKKCESKKEIITKNDTYQKLEKLNICCLNLLQTYREYMKNLKKNM